MSLFFSMTTFYLWQPEQVPEMYKTYIGWSKGRSRWLREWNIKVSIAYYCVKKKKKAPSRLSVNAESSGTPGTLRKVLYSSYLWTDNHKKWTPRYLYIVWDYCIIKTTQLLNFLTKIAVVTQFKGYKTFRVAIKRVRPDYQFILECGATYGVG